MGTPFSRTTRSLATDTARLAISAWVVAGVLLAAWFSWFFLGSVNVYEVSPAARLEVRQAAHPVEASIPGRIVRTSMAIGREVHVGDILIELDSDAETLRLREEEARLQALPPRIESLRTEIALREQSSEHDRAAARAAMEAARFRSAEAAAAMEFANDNARRLKEQSAAGGIAEIEALRAASQSQTLRASNSALTTDVKRLELDAQTRSLQNQAEIQKLKSELVALEGELVTLRASIDRYRLNIDKYRIRAPVSGRIGDAPPLVVGTFVNQGQDLGVVVPPGDLIIVGNFRPAAVVGRIQPGQRARMRLDGFPWVQYGSIEAVVSRVGSEFRDGFVRVEFDVESTGAMSGILQHGLPGSVEVTIDRASPAIIVLRAAGQLLNGVPDAPAAVDAAALAQQR